MCSHLVSIYCTVCYRDIFETMISLFWHQKLNFTILWLSYSWHPGGDIGLYVSQNSGFLFVRGCISIERQHDHCNSPKGKYLIEVAAYSFRGLVHCCRGEHGGV